MVEAKGFGNDDDFDDDLETDDVFVATRGRTARDRAWGVIFGIGKRASRIIVIENIYRFFVSLSLLLSNSLCFSPAGFEIG